MPLIPRDPTFYALFSEQVAIVVQGARTLEAMLETFDDPAARAAELRELEQHGDELNHRIHDRLERTFVTPFGREEIHALAEGLDEVLDQTEEAGDLVVLYGLTESPGGAPAQASILVRQADALEEAIAALPAPKEVRPVLATLHELAQDGNALARTLIQQRFDEAGDVRVLLAALDVHRRIAAANDRADRVGRVLERVVLQSGPW